MLHISDVQLLEVNYYAIIHIAAILTAVVTAGFAAAKTKIGIREFAVIVSFGILTLLIGSKLLRFDSYQWNYLFSQFHLPEENGKSTIGGILGLIIGLCLAARLLGKNESVLNLFALSIPLALAVQGMACLSAGCCHGALTNLPWGITYGPGTRPFIEQQQLGLIPDDAINSLAVHPSQIYTILVCLCIAFIIWKSRFMWKSNTGNFLFALILFLTYRVVEGISAYSLPPVMWLGINSTIWKVLLLILLSTLFIYSEWNARRNTTSTKINPVPSSYNHLTQFMQ